MCVSVCVCVCACARARARACELCSVAHVCFWVLSLVSSSLSFSRSVLCFQHAGPWPFQRNAVTVADDRFDYRLTKVDIYQASLVTERSVNALCIRNNDGQ